MTFLAKLKIHLNIYKIIIHSMILHFFSIFQTIYNRKISYYNHQIVKLNEITIYKINNNNNLAANQ